jgi:alanine-synthesizing transaminase
MILNFPHNPTTSVVERPFFEKIVSFAQEHEMMVIHDLAYADICFDGYRAPSFLEVEGAKDVGVEFFSLSKSYNMPGWRVGFAVGNKRLIGALTRIKSYLDYGMFQPIQIAAIIALNESQGCVKEISDRYRSRRDVLVDCLGKAGWEIEKPKATMFVWATR